MIFDFSGLNKNEETIRSTWNEFRNQLACGEQFSKAMKVSIIIGLCQ